MADDLSIALKDNMVYSAKTDSWRCVRCDALWITAKPAHWRCAICGAEVEHLSLKNYRRPRYYLPFVIDQETAEGLCSDLLKKKLIGMRKRFFTSAIEGLQQIYLSLWLFDLNSVTDYTAQRGYESEEKKIDWTTISGNYSFRINSLTVEAVNSDSVKVLPTPDEYDLSSLQPLADVPQVAVMGYDLNLSDAWYAAQSKAKSEILGAVEQQLSENSGDLIRDICCHINFKDVRFRQVLLPVWLSCCVYHGRTYNIVINGVSGKVKGKVPVSFKNSSYNIC